MTEQEYKQQEEQQWEEVLLAVALILDVKKSTISKMSDDIKLWYSKYGVKGVMSYLESRKIIPKFKTSKKRHLVKLLNSRVDEFIDGQIDVFKMLNKKLKWGLTDDELFKIKWAADGKTLWERIMEDKNNLYNFVEKSVVENLVKNQDADELVKVFDKKLKTYTNRAATRIKTESVALNSKRQLEDFKERDIRKYRFKAVLDDRTSEICRKMNNTIFYVSEFKVGINAPPLHPNCRSYTVEYNGDGAVGTKE